MFEPNFSKESHMKGLLLLILISTSLPATAVITETVYVESPTDTDSDGKKDLIFVTIERYADKKNLPAIYKITPYSHGGNNIDMHTTDVDLLPQDEVINKSLTKENSF